MKSVRTAMEKKTLGHNIDKDDLEVVSSSGMDPSEETRTASFLQQDSRVEFSRSLSDAVDIMGIEEAMRQLPELAGHYGKNFRDLSRDFPRDTQGGYFIRVKKGKSVEMPIQACLLLKAQGFQQKVHNIIIIEEGARAYLITGCSASESAREGFHLGISEFFVQEEAYLNFTMIHSWREDIVVKPMSIASVGRGATFISNYVCLKPVKEISMYPTAVLSGENARASFNSLILSYPGSLQDIGSRAILKAAGTQAEIVSRAVTLGGKVIARGHIKAEEQQIRAHLECRGLILSERGTIHAIPEMESDFRDVDMSHEAAIGKISKEEIEYLCSRGFTREEAQSIIVRGFMDATVLGLPEPLKNEIERLEDKTLKGNF